MGRAVDCEDIAQLAERGLERAQTHIRPRRSVGFVTNAGQRPRLIHGLRESLSMLQSGLLSNIPAAAALAVRKPQRVLF